MSRDGILLVLVLVQDHLVLDRLHHGGTNTQLPLLLRGLPGGLPCRPCCAFRITPLLFAGPHGLLVRLLVDPLLLGPVEDAAGHRGDTHHRVCLLGSGTAELRRALFLLLLLLAHRTIQPVPGLLPGVPPDRDVLVCLGDDPDTQPLDALVHERDAIGTAVLPDFLRRVLVRQGLAHGADLLQLRIGRGVLEELRPLAEYVTAGQVSLDRVGGPGPLEHLALVLVLEKEQADRDAHLDRDDEQAQHQHEAARSAEGPEQEQEQQRSRHGQQVDNLLPLEIRLRRDVELAHQVLDQWLKQDSSSAAHPVTNATAQRGRRAFRSRCHRHAGARGPDDLHARCDAVQPAPVGRDWGMLSAVRYAPLRRLGRGFGPARFGQLEEPAADGLADAGRDAHRAVLDQVQGDRPA